MLSTIDYFSSLALLIVTAVSAVLFTLIVFIQGRRQYDRIEREGDGKILNRKILSFGYWWCLFLARIFIRMKWTPSQVTWLSLLLAVVSAFTLANGLFGITSIIFIIAFFLDVVDGIIARETNASSVTGEILDSSVDRYADFLFLGGLAVYYHQSILLLTLMLFAIVGSFMVSYSSAKAEIKQVEPPKGLMKRTERTIVLLLGCVLSGLSVHLIETPVSEGVYIAYPMVFAVFLVAFLSNISAVHRLKVIAEKAELKNIKE